MIQDSSNNTMQNNGSLNQQHVPLEQIHMQDFGQHQHQYHQYQSQVLLQHVNDFQNNAQLLASEESIFIYSDENDGYCTGGTKDDVDIIDAGKTSVDANNIEDSINDSDIINPDDAFTYLQGLNSGNLMQFSQQSALQELMKDEIDKVKPEIDPKPNLHVLPTFEEHDIGGYNFTINLSNPRKGKAKWIYSETLNKVYVRMNEIFNVEASYTSKLPVQQLRIRALLCFVKEVSEPVLRCQNHMSVDTESSLHVRRSLLRCENPSTEYRGNAQGKSINDRFSIVIPLNASTKKNAVNNTQKQTIALKFTCQNSCIGRKETSVIFLLESLNGEILSQRVLDVKVCSCPKRDRAMDERNLAAPKRKMEEDLYPRRRKVQKQDTKAPFFTQIDTEGLTTEESDPEENSNDSNIQKTSQIVSSIELQTTRGCSRVVIEAGGNEVLPFLEFCYKQMAFKMVNDPSNYAHYKCLYRKMRKSIRKFV